MYSQEEYGGEIMEYQISVEGKGTGELHFGKLYQEVQSMLVCLHFRSNQTFLNLTFVKKTPMSSFRVLMFLVHFQN